MVALLFLDFDSVTWLLVLSAEDFESLFAGEIVKIALLKWYFTRYDAFNLEIP